jgi:hypothetical protein
LLLPLFAFFSAVIKALAPYPVGTARGKPLLQKWACNVSVSLLGAAFNSLQLLGGRYGREIEINE